MKAKMIKKVLSAILFVVSLAPVLSSAEELTPIPQSEWCAAPPEKSAQTEASACMNCFVDQKPGNSKLVTAVVDLGKSFRKETEAEKITREAQTYFVLDQYIERSTWAYKTLYLSMALRSQKQESKPLDSERVNSLKEKLGNEEDYNQLMNVEPQKLSEMIGKFYEKREIRIEEDFKKKNLEELRQYISQVKKNPPF